MAALHSTYGSANFRLQVSQHIVKIKHNSVKVDEYYIMVRLHFFSL